VGTILQNKLIAVKDLFPVSRLPLNSYNFNLRLALQLRQPSTWLTAGKEVFKFFFSAKASVIFYSLYNPFLCMIC
jgi:hypothetical protein